MRVEIRHRDEGEYIKRHVVNLTVELSQEDRRVIDMRGLIGTLLDLSPGVIHYFPIPDGVSKICFLISPVLFLSGCVASCTGAIAGQSFGGGFMVFLAFVLIGVGFFIRIQRARMRSTVSLRELYENPRVNIRVPNPIEAMTVNRSIKRTLSELKIALDEIASLNVEIIEL